MKEIAAARRRARAEKQEWYSLRRILGYKWAIFYFLIGGRETGKSYAVMDFFVHQFVHNNRPFTWLRLTEQSQRKLLNNNAEKLVDMDIRRRYNLDIVTKGENVYVVTKRGKRGKNGEQGQVTEKKLMARVLALSTFYNDKGSGLFDADFLKNPDMYYNLALDEMNKEKNEKRTFDIVYAFVNQLENIVRSTKNRIRIFCIGNLLEDASDILCAFNFLPESYGIYKLKKKRAVIEYIEPSSAYLKRRKGTIADILLPNASTFSNKIETDTTLICKKSLTSPQMVIKFSKDKDEWFTLWNGGIIAKWNGENKTVAAMRPYIDEYYSTDIVNQIVSNFDSRSYKYRNLITFKQFQKNISLLKPRK